MYKKKSLSFREVGQGLVEYALILALVSVVSMMALSALGVNVAGVFEKVTCAIRNEEEDCDLPVPDGGDDGVCGDEQISVVAILCYQPGNNLLMSINSDCDGTEIDVQGRGPLIYNGGTGVESYLGAFPGDSTCTGRPNNTPPTASYNITSHHPDGNYKNYSISPN